MNANALNPIKTIGGDRDAAEATGMALREILRRSATKVQGLSERLQKWPIVVIVTLLATGVAFISNIADNVGKLTTLVADGIWSCHSCPRVLASEPKASHVFALRLDRALESGKVFKLNAGLLIPQADGAALVLGVPAPPAPNEPVELSELSVNAAKLALSSKEFKESVDIIDLPNFLSGSEWPPFLKTALEDKLSELTARLSFTDCKQIDQFITAEKVLSQVTVRRGVPLRSELSLIKLATGCPPKQETPNVD